MPHRAGREELKPTQRRALASLDGGGADELTRGHYQQLAGVSRSQAAYDLAELVELGLLERVGAGRSTRYRLARKAAQPSQRHWTNERIGSALESFCAGKATWPSAGEFKRGGHADLYVAASRYGGIGYWASELGFSRPERPPARVRASRRPLLRPAAVGAVLTAALFGVAGAFLYPWHGKPARTAQSAPSAPKTQTQSKPAALPSRARRVKAAPRRPHRPSARQSRLSSQPTAQTISAQAAVAPPRQQPPPPASTGTPAPLPSPSGGSSAAPAPLPSP